jgi:Zn-dependent protease with chaperone function
VVQRLPLRAPTRAAVLAQIRLLPLIAVVVLVSAQVVSFLRFEREVVGESAGPLLLITAAPGVALLVDAMLAAWKSWRVTRAVVGTWRTSAVPLVMPMWRLPAWRIERQFPVVAVVGIVRPELVVASPVANACTEAELAAIAAHESAHVKHGDNVLRAAFSITPGATFLRALAGAIQRDWSVAAELAADEKARCATSALDLASALTKVARMAVGQTPATGVGSALIGETPLETRVRALLEPPAPERRIPVATAAAAGWTATVGLLHQPQTLDGLHKLFELLVRR